MLFIAIGLILTVLGVVGALIMARRHPSANGRIHGRPFIMTLALLLAFAGIGVMYISAKQVGNQYSAVQAAARSQGIKISTSLGVIRVETWVDKPCYVELFSKNNNLVVMGTDILATPTVLAQACHQ